MRQKKSKWHKFVKLLLKYVFILLVISITVNFVWSVLLKLEQLGLDPDTIRIEGNSMVSENSILGALNLKYGQNILKINTRELTYRLESYPRIAHAKIRRDFPNSLYVVIREVTPAGYLMINGKRYVVTLEGDMFPGLEGPSIEFRNSKPDIISKLALLLEKIKNIDEDFYNTVVAVDCNYMEELIVFRQDYYIKYPVINEIDEVVLKRYIYITDKAVGQYKKESKEITYIDLRFVDFEGGRVKGAVIIK